MNPTHTRRQTNVILLDNILNKLSYLPVKNDNNLNGMKLVIDAKNRNE